MSNTIPEKIMFQLSFDFCWLAVKLTSIPPEVAVSTIF